MIEHVNLSDGSGVTYTEQDISASELSATMDLLRGMRTPFDDGYYISAGHIEIADTEYLFGLYTPRADPFERWIGFHFEHESVDILSAALVHRPEQFLQARERLYGAWLGGMPHRPPIIFEYPVAEHFPCLLTVSLCGALDVDRAYHCHHVLEFAPTFALAIVKLFEEQ